VKGDEAGRVGGSDSGASVAHGLVRDGELAEVHADHLGLNLHAAEHLAVVDSDDGADHLGDNDHVTEVGLDAPRLLADGGVLLGGAEALDERHGLALEAAGHAAAGAAGHEVHELVVGQVEELVEVNALEGELPEGTLLAKLGYFVGVHGCIKGRAMEGVRQTGAKRGGEAATV